MEPLQTPPNPIPPQKPPYSYMSMMISSFFFGVPGTILIIWRNYLRIGKVEAGKKFLIYGLIGSLAIIVCSIALALISPSLSPALWIIGYLLVYQFNKNHLKAWQIEHPNLPTKFDISMIGWGFLGLAFYITAYLISISVVGRFLNIE